MKSLRWVGVLSFSTYALAYRNYVYTYMLTYFIVVNVIRKDVNLGFSTCLNFGNNYWRTFDGVEYEYNGLCKYVLAKSPTHMWHVNVKMVDCELFSTCRKVCHCVIQYAVSKCGVVLSHIRKTTPHNYMK